MELLNKVLDSYKSIIEVFSTSNRTAIVIAPILTVGGVAFDSFDSENSLKANYKFYDGETVDGKYARYEPRFCVQPIFYLLSFVAKKYKIQRNNTGLLESIFQSISDFFDKNQDFLIEMTKIDKLRIKNGNGYKLLCGNDLFYSKND